MSTWVEELASSIVICKTRHVQNDIMWQMKSGLPVFIQYAWTPSYHCTHINSNISSRRGEGCGGDNIRFEMYSINSLTKNRTRFISECIYAVQGEEDPSWLPGWCGHVSTILLRMKSRNFPSPLEVGWCPTKCEGRGGLGKIIYGWGRECYSAWCWGESLGKEDAAMSSLSTGQHALGGEEQEVFFYVPVSLLLGVMLGFPFTRW